MKKFYLMSMLLLIVLSGCTQNHALIKANSTSVRTDVFEELTERGMAPQGYTDLRVSSTLKTHHGAFAATDKHGTPEYRLLLNIDGQVLQLIGDLQMENKETASPTDPDAGDGIRYRFSKNLRLKGGSHKLVVALPEDGIALEKDIILSEGEFNSLELRPVYGSRQDTSRRYYNTRSFKEGVKTFRVVVNGKEI